MAEKALVAYPFVGSKREIQSPQGPQLNYERLVKEYEGRLEAS
jgi:hypothetical protein